MDRIIKAGFLSQQNYLDKNTFSGTLYYMYHALKSRGVELVELKKPKTPSLINRAANRALNRLGFSSTAGKTPDLAEFKQQVQRNLKSQVCDVIFAPVASDEIDLIETSIPIVFLSDATPKLIHNEYYNFFDGEENFAVASSLEERVISKSQKLIYPSRWAAESAVEDYGADPGKVHVVPFGANLDSVPEISQIQARLSSSCCRLLFIGKDWRRKGGNIAFGALSRLIDLGLDAKLTMIGCTPPEDIVAQAGDRLTIIPFLDKNVARERERLHQILLDAHFLMLPTRADCSPIVLYEAAAFGLPTVSSNVGGISTIVEEGVNGYTFPVEADADHYAKQMAAVFSDRDAYKPLVLSSRRAYEDRLNWHVWANDVRDVMLELL